MSVIKSPLADPARKITGEALQGALVDLLDLSLAAKQVHWNLVGKNFRSIHLELDEVVEIARQYADVVAERAVAIGVTPDGRAATISSGTALPGVDTGWIEDANGVGYMIEALVNASHAMRQRIDETAEADPVTQDIFFDITKDLEKQAWMFEAQRAGAS